MQTHSQKKKSIKKNKIKGMKKKKNPIKQIHSTYTKNIEFNTYIFTIFSNFSPLDIDFLISFHFLFFFFFTLNFSFF